jgi:hypothetical protein
METKRISKTLTGIEFQYKGSLSSDLIIYRNNSNFRIKKEIIDFIKLEIQRWSPVLMGACRDRPCKNSIGETLKLKHQTPQYSSYVIPLLAEEGFCIASNKRPFVVTKI